MTEQHSSQKEQTVTTSQTCTSCGLPAPNRLCSNSHIVCENCIRSCQYCNNITCLSCNDNMCCVCQLKITEYSNEIKDMLAKGKTHQALSIANKGLAEFKDNYVFTALKDQIKFMAEFTKQIPKYRAEKLFHQINVGCERIRSFGFNIKVIERLEQEALEKQKEADQIIANGYEELNIRHRPRLALERVTDAFGIIADYPEAQKLKLDAEHAINEAKKNFNLAKAMLEECKFYFAEDHANKASSIDSYLGYHCKEIIAEAEQKRKHYLKKRIWKVSLSAIIVVSLTLAIGYKVITHRIQKQEYEKILIKIENITDVTEKKNILDQLTIKEDAPFKDQIELKKKEINVQLHKQKYEALVQKTNELLQANKLQTALDHYNAFLKEYPQGEFSGFIQEQIENVQNRIQEADFQHLISSIKKLSNSQKLEACNRFLTQYSNGLFKDQVMQLIQKIYETMYAQLNSQLQECQSKQNWEICIQLCDTFLKQVSNHEYTREIIKLKDEFKNKFNQKKEVMSLIETVSRSGQDSASIRQMYLDYLSSHPDTYLRNEIEKKIAEADKQLEERKQWLEFNQLVKNPKYPLEQRIQYVEKRLKTNPFIFFANQATALYQELLAEKMQIISQKQLAEEKKQQEINEKKQTFRQMIEPYKNTYQEQANGLILDRRTGLMWTMFDSKDDQGSCMTYEQASEYINGLNSGGYTDWRMPTENELIQILKNEPYFPVIGVERWYWTSKMLLHGWNEVVSVVTTRKERTFKPIQYNGKECGYVKAVRP
ncbi:MAG: DUF1566 domain-containing protein [Desulfobacterales bacterium]|nr:DUF1566 domain-containing protein [Desulfobacterales bacterium]